MRFALGSNWPQPSPRPPDVCRIQIPSIIPDHWPCSVGLTGALALATQRGTVSTTSNLLYVHVCFLKCASVLTCKLPWDNLYAKMQGRNKCVFFFWTPTRFLNIIQWDWIISRQSCSCQLKPHAAMWVNGASLVQSLCRCILLLRFAASQYYKYNIDKYNGRTEGTLRKNIGVHSCSSVRQNHKRNCRRIGKKEEGLLQGDWVLKGGKGVFKRQKSKCVFPSQVSITALPWGGPFSQAPPRVQKAGN